MIIATNLKNGTTFLMNGKPYRVVKYTHQKIARGGGTVKLSVRNLETGNLEKKTFNSSAKVEETTTVKRPLQYLYKDDTSVYFMDTRSYEQIEIPLVIAKDQIVFIKEGESVDVLFWENKALSIGLPAKVVLTVKDTVPGVKGNSATNIFKPATLENGLKLKVPLFIKKGDKIRIDTRTGEYVERAN
jgi:elongation factor P